MKRPKIDLAAIDAKKPKRGRPKSHFVKRRDYWCFVHKMFCDEARMNGKCREELPVHTMPYPFKDFNCQRYLILPDSDVLASEPAISRVLCKALKMVAQHTKSLVDCQLSIKEISKESDGKYKIVFGVSFLLKAGERKSRRLVVTVPAKL